MATRVDPPRGEFTCYTPAGELRWRDGHWYGPPALTAATQRSGPIQLRRKGPYTTTSTTGWEGVAAQLIAAAGPRPLLSGPVPHQLAELLTPTNYLPEHPDLEDDWSYDPTT